MQNLNNRKNIPQYMKVICNGERVNINEDDIENRFKLMYEAYRKLYHDGTWDDYCECNRAIDAEIERRVVG